MYIFCFHAAFLKSTKSSKQQRVAIDAAIWETNKWLKTSSELEHTISVPINDEQNMAPTNINKPKKKRCPTKVKMIPEKNYQKMKLEFSKYGQVFENNR